MILYILQFLTGFSLGFIAYQLGLSRGKRFVATNIADLMVQFRGEASKKQNVGGDADEHLRLEGEIRGYDRFLKDSAQ